MTLFEPPRKTVLTINGTDWPIDAVTSLSYTANSTATKHPVERSGADGLSEISDHIELEPTKITLSGVMSESPLRGSAQANFEGLFSGGQQWAFIEALQTARLQRQLVSLDAGKRGSWDNLVISFDPSWTVENGYSVLFNLDLEQIELVRSRVQFGLSQSATVALGVLQLFSDPVSVVTGTTEASGAQAALMADAGSFPGVPAGVDFVAGR